MQNCFLLILILLIITIYIYIYIYICVSLSNQKCEIQPTLINLHPNEYNQEFYYYPFPVKLDKSFDSCNTLNDLSSKVCITNKAEDLNLSIFNTITGTNESKTLTNDISFEYKC